MDNKESHSPLYGDGTHFYQVFILTLAVFLGFVHTGYAGDVLIRFIRTGHLSLYNLLSIGQSILIGIILVIGGFYFLHLSCKVLKKNLSGKENWETKFLDAKNKKRYEVGGFLFGFLIIYTIIFSISNGGIHRYELILHKPLETVVIPLIVAGISIVLIYKSIKYDMTKHNR